MESAKHTFYQALDKFMPIEAMDYCYELWVNDPFHLKIKKERVSKLGDYRYNPTTKTHSISVNNNLNPYAFLITYLHEIAHLKTFKEFKRSVKPHGKEWKNNFKRLVLPVLNNEVFPEKVLRPLVAYMKNPKAASCSDHKLLAALSQFDFKPKTLLSEVKSGDVFVLGNKKFKKGALRRTRYVCLDVDSGKRYLVSRSASVDTI